jgi:hypothetical protein
MLSQNCRLGGTPRRSTPTVTVAKRKSLKAVHATAVGCIVKLNICRNTIFSPGLAVVTYSSQSFCPSMIPNPYRLHFVPLPKPRHATPIARIHVALRDCSIAQRVLPASMTPGCMGCPT